MRKYHLITEAGKPDNCFLCRKSYIFKEVDPGKLYTVECCIKGGSVVEAEWIKSTGCKLVELVRFPAWKRIS